MYRISIVVLILQGLCACCFAYDQPLFAVARKPVPVFNTAQAARPDAAHKRDRCGQVRELELIALPGTVFRVVSSSAVDDQVLQVTTDDYQAPPGTRLYVSNAALETTTTEPEPRKPQLPQRESILQSMRSAAGVPYVWGGNLRGGVRAGTRHQFAGLDCSGLLYEASNGYTPRNTEQLVQFGTSVQIEGVGTERLVQQLRPLDLIVWKGHVVIVLDQHNTIESAMNCGDIKNGVVITPLKKRLEQLLKQRRPVNTWPADTKKAALFVVRRWL